MPTKDTSMVYPEYTAEELGRKGREIYEGRLRARVEHGNQGRFLVLDVESGEYEIADDDLTATQRLLARCPQGRLYGLRIGARTAYHIGFCTGRDGNGTRHSDSPR